MKTSSLKVSMGTLQWTLQMIVLERDEKCTILNLQRVLSDLLFLVGGVWVPPVRVKTTRAKMGNLKECTTINQKKGSKLDLLFLLWKWWHWARGCGVH